MVWAGRWMMADDDTFSLNSTLTHGEFDPQKTHDALGGVIGQLTQSADQNEKAESMKQFEGKYNLTDDTVEGKISGNLFRQWAQDSKDMQGIKSEYQKMLAQNQQQMQAMQQHPWANTLAQIAAGVSSQSKNPIVRGIGIGAERLNPTTQDLQKQRMGLLQGEEGALGQSMAANTQMARMGQDTKMLEFQRKSTGDANKIAADYLNKTRLAARGGAGPLPYEAFQSGAVAAGVPAERIPGLYQAHTAEATLASKSKDQDVDRAEKKMTFGESLREKLAGVQGRISAGNRVAAINQAFQNSISPDALSAKEKIHAANKAIDDSFASSKELRVLGPQVQKDLSAASKTN